MLARQATASTHDNDWELDPNEIIFHEKIASGAFGDLFRGSYCGQDVAIKILRNVHEDSQQFQEFLQVRWLVHVHAGWWCEFGLGGAAAAGPASKTGVWRANEGGGRVVAGRRSLAALGALRPASHAEPSLLLSLTHHGSQAHPHCEQEVAIMRKVRHKNIVQFIGACTQKPNLCIVFEFMSGGSVYDYIRKVGSQGVALGAEQSSRAAGQ